MIHISIETKPLPKARPRFLRHSGRVYTPQKTLSFEAIIANSARRQITTPLEGAIHLRVVFNFIRAKSSKKTMHTQRPDIDNLLKSVMDGLNGVAFIDDCQVTKLECEKQFADKESIEIFLSVISL